MNALALDHETIMKRVNGIYQELKELETLGSMPFNEFKEGVGFKLAQFHLHRALEGIFHISSHILSRIPGAQVTEYKAMAKKLGEIGVVERSFADHSLVQMAGYRNRLVHFYAEVTPEELFEILQTQLTDIETFLVAVKGVLENPTQFGLANTA